jgi:sugar/nucleoside kinase (ribokinase family)
MIYCYGVTAISRIYRLKMDFPKPNGYAEVIDEESNIGGEAVGTAMCLARFGHKVALDGLKVSRHGAGKAVFQKLSGLGIDASRIKSSRRKVGAVEAVYSDKTSRTVFANYVNVFSTYSNQNRPSAVLIRKASHVTIDPFLKADSDLAARLARQYQVPYSLMDLHHDNPALSSAASVILSGDFTSQFYKGKSVQQLFRLYLSRMAGLLIVTQGSKAVWYGRRGKPVGKFTPISVKVKDKTGAADAFRGGVVHGLLNQWPDSKTVAFASALAAIICQSFPGCMQGPSLTEVEAFLKSRSKW